MTSLIDRYVFTALRRVPEQQRGDIDRELRASIEDAVEARVEHGEDRDAAVESTLIELGDPDRLADSYANRKNYLIGPELYPIWRRVLTRLLSTVLPLVVVIVAVVQGLDDPNIGKIIGSAFGAALSIATHMAFWVTLIFAMVERAEPARERLQVKWTPKDLPKYESNRRTRGQLAASMVWPVLLIAALVLQQFYFTDEPVLNPDNWSFWWPYLIVVFVLECAYAALVYRLDVWTHRVTVVNAVLALMAAVPVIWLLAAHRFFDPAFIHGLNWGEIDPLRWLTVIAVLVVVGGALWDIVEVTVRVERGRRGLPTKVWGSGNYNFT